MSSVNKTNNSHRLLRINDMLHKQLIIILRRESNDPRLNNLNITGVEVSRDLSIAKIYYTDLLSSNLSNNNNNNNITYVIN